MTLPLHITSIAQRPNGTAGQDTDYFLIQRGTTPGAFYHLTGVQLKTFFAGSSASWGNITGTLSAQTDLVAALSAKAPLASPTFTGTVTLPAGQVVNGVTLTTAGGTSNFLRADGSYAVPPGTAVSWGSITGTLSSQTDLASALNAKAPLASPTFTGTVTLPASQIVNGVTLTTGGGTTNFLRADGTYAAPPAAGAPAWGTITGTLSAQTDLQTALNAKAPLASPTFTGTVTLPASQVVNGVTLTTGGGTTNFLRADGTYAAPTSGITGPGTTTDTAIPRWNGTTGSALSNSSVLIDGSNNVSGIVALGSGAHIITSAGAAALAVGANGSTNPALAVDASTASSVTGLIVKSAAAAAGVALTATSSGTNESLTISAKGTGNLTMAAGTQVQMSVNGAVFSGTAAQLSFTNTTRSNLGSNLPGFLFTTLAASNQGAGVEINYTHFNQVATQTHATGTLARNRDFRITGANHAFVAASALTDLAAFSVDLSTGASANATIANIHNILVQGVALTGTKTNSWGITVIANTGATNNYALQLLGGASFIGDIASDPAVTPSAGGFLYSKSGSLYWKGSSGTVTSIAPA